MIATMPTLERFTTPIGLAFHWMNVQTLVARLRRICRVNCNQFHPVLHALVAQKQPQLEERPTIGTSTFRLVSRQFIGARSYARQVFNRNNGIAPKCTQDNRFTDVVSNYKFGFARQYTDIGASVQRKISPVK